MTHRFVTVLMTCSMVLAASFLGACKGGGLGGEPKQDSPSALAPLRAAFDDDASYQQQLGQFFLNDADSAAASGEFSKAAKSYVSAYDAFMTLVNLRPEHELSPRYEVVAAHALIKAADAYETLGNADLTIDSLAKAIEVMKHVASNEGAPKELRAESNYFVGDAYLKLGESELGRSALELLVSEFGDTKWAEFAAARLGAPAGETTEVVDDANGESAE